jgi:hypothetical protein
MGSDTAIWSCAPDKLYHNCQSYSKQATIGGLIKGQKVFLQVDSFNENGITEGEVSCH